jgi:hypothetical protein
MSQPAPILRVTVGAPVYAQDGAKIGKVKEVRGQAFKVETGLFSKDYWLTGNTVAQATPGEAVTLGVGRAELDAHKVSEPQAA